MALSCCAWSQYHHSPLQSSCDTPPDKAALKARHRLNGLSVRAVGLPVAALQQLWGMKVLVRNLVHPSSAPLKAHLGRLASARYTKGGCFECVMSSCALSTIICSMSTSYQESWTEGNDHFGTGAKHCAQGPTVKNV